MIQSSGKLSNLPMAPIRHIAKRVAKSVSMSLSSFLSNVLLLEGTFMVFIITFNSNNVSTNNQLKKIH